MKKSQIAFLFLSLAFLPRAFALGQPSYVEMTSQTGSFPIFEKGAAADVFVDANDFPGVIRAAHDLQADIGRVTGSTPKLVHLPDQPGKTAIIIGTIGKSELIDRLIREGKIDVTEIKGKWESFFVQVVANPLPGVEHGLVIAGSDKRGTIYGIYDLSEQMGVSPWYYWADVAVPHRDAVFVKPGKFVQGSPSVKYRGIFFNDEAPDLTRWVAEKYGQVAGLNDVANYGRGFYTNVFELILRLKGNYLWPAMWNNAFNVDDPENPRLADEYGIVMGTTHQEPMLRAQKEWDRSADYGKKYGNWNYSVTNQQPVLEKFWREGARRNKDFESIFTLGLRAENDSGTPIGRELTGEIVNLQRKILTEEVNPDITKVPQLWCLYKEVQGFYNKGLHPPDDVTLLWAEDNWGDVRRLPTADERKRSGGAGIYYHFDYHGGPRSYQWLNTSPIPKIWDQMSLAKQYGADRIWIVNVGHFKGYELPTEFFLNFAWNTSRWTNDNLGDFTRLWAAREFGPEHADEIAAITSQFTKLNGRRKPELVDASTYSLVNYQEAETMVADFNALATAAEKISHELPETERNSFYELVLFPIKASAQLNALYLAANQNAVYSHQGRASANDYAAKTRSLFGAETNLMDEFNRTFMKGKWDHFMDQPVIGYVTWRDPPRNTMSAIKLTEQAVPDAPALGLAVEGSVVALTNGESAALPQIDAFNRQRHYLDLFNKGKGSVAFTAAASDPWIILSNTKGTIEKDQRLWVTIDWDQAPKDIANGTIKISGANESFILNVIASNPTAVTRDSLQGFAEGEGVVSIEPEHYTKKTDTADKHWIKIEDYGRTLSGMKAIAPVDLPSARPGTDSPALEYQMYLFETGPAQVTTITSPTLNFVPDRGLRFAISFDDEPPQTVTLVPQGFNTINGNSDWETTVKDNARYTTTTMPIAKPGYHTLKIWMVDPGVVLQKIIVNFGGLKPSYLGPPESYHRELSPAR